MAGRKNKYQTHVAPRLKDIEHWCRDGLTEDEIRRRLGVAMSSFSKYKTEYTELSDALKRGKEEADYEVEDSLFMNAKGYEYEEETWERVTIRPYWDPEKEKMITSELQLVKKVKKKKHPDTTAGIFWLKNRQPDKWRDKQDIEHSGEVNSNVDLSGLSVEELRKIANSDN